MKKYLFIALLILLICTIAFCITGCKKVVSTEYITVDATIIDTYHRSTYTTPMKVGKTTTLQVHPAVYKTYLKYNNEEYSVSGSDIYNYCKKRIGSTIKCEIQIDTYDDGSKGSRICAVGI